MTPDDWGPFVQAYGKMLRHFGRSTPSREDLEEIFETFRDVSLEAMTWGMGKAIEEAMAVEGRDYPPSPFKILHWAKRAPKPQAVDKAKELPAHEENFIPREELPKKWKALMDVVAARCRW